MLARSLLASRLTAARFVAPSASVAPRALVASHICRPFSSTPATFASPSVTYNPPRVLREAPDFSGTAVVDGEFKKISLSDFKGSYLVLFFYPLDHTFVCPSEIVAFSDRMPDFQKIGCNVVGVSVDSEYSHLAWINTPRKSGGLGGLSYPLLSDITKEISSKYGVLIEDKGFSLRGLFIIDPSGIVRQITINDNPVGRSIDEVLRLVRAFQYTDQHGEVCPANWVPGEKTIIPTPEDSKKYFSQVEAGKKDA